MIMNIITNKIDLGKSFDKLKEEMDRTKGDNMYFSEKYLILKSAIQSHIVECDAGNSVLAADPDDLKDINTFSQ